MSQENVEVVLDQYAATNERDFRRAMSFYDDDVELVAREPWLRTGVFKDREAKLAGVASASRRRSRRTPRQEVRVYSYDRQRREFHEALLDADSFGTCPESGRQRSAILKAEATRRSSRIVDGDVHGWRRGRKSVDSPAHAGGRARLAWSRWKSAHGN